MNTIYMDVIELCLWLACYVAILALAYFAWELYLTVSKMVSEWWKQWIGGSDQ